MSVPDSICSSRRPFVVLTTWRSPIVARNLCEKSCVKTKPILEYKRYFYCSGGDSNGVVNGRTSRAAMGAAVFFVRPICIEITRVDSRPCPEVRRVRSKCRRGCRNYKRLPRKPPSARHRLRTPISSEHRLPVGFNPTLWQQTRAISVGPGI